ncbi:MAG: ATP-binding protein [Rhodanobacter sp.]
MNAVAREVKLQVNESALFRNMEHAFSANTVLGELIQNARRAGASNIQVFFNGTALTVKDDGRGIGNLQNLLTAAGSGWNEKVAKEEHPFGLGFLSTLYVCKMISVSSRERGKPDGENFNALTEELLDQKGATVAMHVAMDVGTIVQLLGFDIPALRDQTDELQRMRAVGRVLAEMVKGFPIPVFYNGEELERPHAVGEGFDATGVGHVRLDMDSIHWDHLYLQGLPISTNNRFGPRSSIGSVLHLDSTFVAKMPDRTELVDPIMANERVNRAKRLLARQRLDALKASMDPESFVKSHAAQCVDWGCVDLLNDVDVVPGKWFVDWNYEQAGPDRTGCSRDVLGGVLSREDLEAARVFVMPDSGEGLAQCWLMEGKHYAHEVTHVLDDGHWLKRLAVEISNSDVEVIINGEIGRSDVYLIGPNDGIELVVADEVLLRHNASCITYASNVAYQMETLTLFCARSANASSGTVQLGTYEDEHDQYREEWEDEDSRDVDKAKMEMLANDPAELLTIMLNLHGGLSANTQLANGTFTVTFDENGKLKEVLAV